MKDRMDKTLPFLLGKHVFIVLPAPTGKQTLIYIYQSLSSWLTR